MIAFRFFIVEILLILNWLRIMTGRLNLSTPAGLTTTRTAGGLDFTAKGGKRQGRTVPRSLRVKPVQSPAMAGFGKPNHLPSVPQVM
jgi:hypothetical protein